MNNLVTLVTESKAKYVFLSAYTDLRGNSEYNMKLSVKRALSCCEYLISQGVKESQIRYTGFGESNPVNECGIEPCPDKLNKMNRRIEFSLLYNELASFKFVLGQA